MKQRLLIIEDELPMRTALADALAADGYRVLTAEDGASGLEKALREQPDLVLLGGTIAAAVVGYLSIWFLIEFLRRNSTMIFIVYRIALGAVILVLLGLGVLSPHA